MKVFADTSYFVAQLNEDDASHLKANEFASGFYGILYTTEYVLLELANWFSTKPRRSIVPQFIRDLYNDFLSRFGVI
jgi:hypothetical protein